MNQETTEALEALQGMVEAMLHEYEKKDSYFMFKADKKALEVLVKYGYAVKVSHEPLRYKLIKGE